MNTQIQWRSIFLLQLIEKNEYFEFWLFSDAKPNAEKA
jgi:hypothetical protein